MHNKIAHFESKPSKGFNYKRNFVLEAKLDHFCFLNQISTTTKMRRKKASKQALISFTTTLNMQLFRFVPGISCIQSYELIVLTASLNKLKIIT